jgi:hypothetical protein
LRRVVHFDVDEPFEKPEAPKGFEDYIPGIGRVYSTPVVGLWKNGVLIQKGAGVEGRKILIDRYELGISFRKSR